MAGVAFQEVDTIYPHRGPVELEVDKSVLRVRISDDGRGGADPNLGSGIVGLRDRVEAVGGTMGVTSPPGGGTSILAEFPLQPPAT
jgi:signal transduction histidine kinase